MNTKSTPPPSHARRRPLAPGRKENGSAVIIVFVVVTILLSLLMSNVRTVRALDRELRLVERRQISRWTNAKMARPPARIQADNKGSSTDHGRSPAGAVSP